MNSKPPDTEKMDAILAYLPIFNAPGFNPVVKWNGGRSSSTDVFVMAWPTYDASVTAFFDALSKEYWRDDAYDVEITSRMIRDPERIGCASLEEIRAMLTFCLRGERFCDGHWKAMLNKGFILQLLTRLQDLRVALEDQ